MECDITALESKIGKETYKDCCMACTLGITVASMSQRCSGIAGSFGEPWQVEHSKLTTNLQINVDYCHFSHYQ